MGTLTVSTFLIRTFDCATSEASMSSVLDLCLGTRVDRCDECTLVDLNFDRVCGRLKSMTKSEQKTMIRTEARQWTSGKFQLGLKF